MNTKERTNWRLIKYNIKYWIINHILTHLGIKTPDQRRAFIELKKLQHTLNGAHFINLKIRANGEWKEIEGDFIKYLI